MSEPSSSNHRASSDEMRTKLLDNYETHLDVRYEQLEVVDVNQIISETTHPWFNATLTKVNESVVRVGIVQGEYHWHKHDDDDEFFFVLSGKLLLDLEDRTIELTANQGITVPKGVLHRTRALEKTVMLMVENSGIIPTGD